MNTRRTKLGLLAILAGGLSASAMASGFFWDNFESYTVGTNLAALSAQGWGASDASVMVTNNVFGNPTNMAALPPNTVLTNTVGMAPGAPGKIWTDCLIDETMRVDPISLPLLESNTMVMAGVTTDGFAAVYNTASNGWDICTNDARGSAVAGLSAAAWARLSLCEDFASNQVALFLNGRLLRQGIPFITNQTSYAQVTFSSGDSSTGYVDEVYVSNAVPATLAGQAPSSTNDINGDGIVDAVEIMQYGAIAKMVPGDIATITGAVAAAHAGDRIVVSNGTYATSFTLSNGVTLIRGILSANATNLTIQGSVTVGTGTVVAASGVFAVTGQVSVAAGGVLTISNAAASFGGLTIGAGGVVHVIDGTLTVWGITKTGTFDVTPVDITATVSGAYGAISPTGIFSVITFYSNVTYTLTANAGDVVGTLTNNNVDVRGSLIPTGIRTWTYTDDNITNARAIVASFSHAGIWYVPGDYTTVTDVLAVAQPNDQIVVSNGTYEGSITLSNGVALISTNMTEVVANTNLSIHGAMTVVQTGMVYSAGAQGLLTVTGQVTIADGSLLTISNTVANFGGLSIGGGGFLHVVNGALIVGGYTNTASDFTLSLVTNMVSAGVGGSITPSGTSTMISTWSNVTYSLTADPGYLVGALTNNGADVGGALVGAGGATAAYTNLAANITANQIITAAFIKKGVLYVPGDFTTISNALAVAQPDGQIFISDGMYAETLVVGNSVKLFGTNVTGLAGVTVQANQNLVLSGFSSFVVTNLVIQSGATVVVSNGTAVTVGGVTLTGPFTMNSAWATALTRSSINFTNDFEAYSLSQPLALCGGQGWGASESGSIIQNSVYTNGHQAALLVPHSELSNTVSAATLNKVWSDVWLNDRAIKYAELAYPETNGNLAVMVFVNTNNRVVIWNSTAWDECALDVVGNNAPGVSTGTWVRVSIFEDFTAQKAALFVNGQLLRQQVPFVSRVDSYQGLSLSSGDGEAYMDDVKIWTNMPPGLTNGANCDLDRDGIPDALEIQNYGNVALSPQGSIYTIR